MNPSGNILGARYNFYARSCSLGVSLAGNDTDRGQIAGASLAVSLLMFGHVTEWHKIGDSGLKTMIFM